MPGPASRAGRGWKIQVAWLAAQWAVYMWSSEGDSLGQFGSSEV